MKNNKTKKIVVTGLLSAMAYISLFFIRVPIIPSASFLKLDIKDVFIAMGAFLFGPLYGVVMAFVVSFLQMLTASEYGLIGLAMNTLSSTAFVCVASIIYNKTRSIKGMIIGLITGCLSMTIAMLMWNFLFTPLYMGVSREVVTKMLIPVFLPFNLIKSGVNSVITFILFKSLGERFKNKEWM